MPPSRSSGSPVYHSDLHPDILLFDRWPPTNTCNSMPACPASRPSKPALLPKRRLSHADLAQLKLSVACILQMHVRGDPHARNLCITPVPPGCRKNSRVNADPSGWPLYVARLGPASAPALVAFDVFADQPASQVSERISALVGQRVREIVLLCPCGLPKLPARSIHVQQDKRAAERRRHDPCVLLGQSGGCKRRTNRGGTNGEGGACAIGEFDSGAHGYKWVVLSGYEILDLHGIMLAAVADQLTVVPVSRELAGSCGLFYVTMYCAMVNVTLSEPSSLRVGSTRCSDATLVWRARTMARQFRVPWGAMLETMREIAKVEGARAHRPRSLGGVDRFC